MMIPIAHGSNTMAGKSAGFADEIQTGHKPGDRPAVLEQVENSDGSHQVGGRPG